MWSDRCRSLTQRPLKPPGSSRAAGRLDARRRGDSRAARGAAREVQDELVETLDGVRADLPVAEVAKARDRGVRHEPELIARVRHRRGHRDDDARTTREARRGAETTEARRTRKRARASSRKRSVESVAPAPPRSARIESPGPARDPAPSRAEAERTRRALSRRSTCRDTPSRARSTTESPERRTRANVACRVERRRMSGKSGIVSVSVRSVYLTVFPVIKKVRVGRSVGFQSTRLCGCWRLRHGTNDGDAAGVLSAP